MIQQILYHSLSERIDKEAEDFYKQDPDPFSRHPGKCKHIF